jgi:alkylation response protein AidB-like acyl-CoA dehydrogenase
MAFTHSWFRHERLMIGARSCGAMARLIEDTMAFANERIIDGAPLTEKQAIQFMLADCATELYAARLMTYDAARASDDGADLKTQHSRCSPTVPCKSLAVAATCARTWPNVSSVNSGSTAYGKARARYNGL